MIITALDLTPLNEALLKQVQLKGLSPQFHHHSRNSFQCHCRYHHHHRDHRHHRKFVIIGIVMMISLQITVRQQHQEPSQWDF